MENQYNDEILPENFEQIAKAYSKSLKEKGFIFINLEEEEFELLLGEIFVVIAKMQSCLKKMENFLDSKILFNKLENARKQLSLKFSKKKTCDFKCILNETNAFLCLVSLFGTLIIKLMLLAIKSGELEICNQIIVSVSSVFAESFSLEGFKPF